MEVLAHHIYEYNKGLRNLVLHTMSSANREKAERKLKSNHIKYYIQEVSAKKINVFFGTDECVEVIMHVVADKSLNELTPAEDFILGTLLGYDKKQQCSRLLKKLQNEELPKMRIA